MGLKLMWASQDSESHFCLKSEWLGGNCASQWKYTEGMSLSGQMSSASFHYLHFNANPIYSHQCFFYKQKLRCYMRQEVITTVFYIWHM